ncbi:MAG: TraR/DksA C4-type zinc finger protein [bacterium]
MSKKILCELCRKEIPRERLAILPETTTCVKCSQATPYSEAEVLGFENIDHVDRNNIEFEEFEDTFE